MAHARSGDAGRGARARHGPERRALLLVALAAALLAGVTSGLALTRWLFKAPTPGPTPPQLPQAAAPSPPTETPARDEPGEAIDRPRTPRLPNSRRVPRPELTARYDWPPEPQAPPRLDQRRFAAALVRLCGAEADPTGARRYAELARQHAARFDADPFLLGALVVYATDCGARPPRYGVGLTGLDPSLYEADIRDGSYHYRVFDGTRWRARALDVGRYPFRADHLARPEVNLYFAAAFLRAWRAQARGARAAFPQTQDARHYVAHFIWGDVVQSRREEDWILVERRRLLEYYGARTPPRAVTWRGIEFSCPLDGCPRVITSTLGAAREGGKRKHRGVDFESRRGEPVRAVADGVVVFAGVDLPGRAANRRIPIYAQRSVARSVMGAGGLYVCIRHPAPQGGAPVVSCYMHLLSADVSQGREVKAGDVIGRVGRSGIKVSAPHLHFELHAEDGIHAATEVLRGLVLGPPPG